MHTTMSYAGNTLRKKQLLELSEVDANYRKIHKNICGPKYAYYHELCRKYSKKEAVARIVQKYPSLLCEEGSTRRDVWHSNSKRAQSLHHRHGPILL